MSEIKYPEYPVLIVDDEENALESFEITLNSSGIENILICRDSMDVLTLLKTRKFEIILLDLTMPHVTGEELLPQIVQDYPDTPVIIITGDIEIETAVKCMQMGAFDYMVKPVEEERLISGVKRGIDYNRLQRENMELKQQFLYGKLTHPDAFAQIITGNPTMISILKYIEVIAKSPEPVLLTGETGVGKELIARALHQISGRKGNFVPVNVAGLDDTIFSDTLFGHLKGAFTDAHQSRKGLIEQASGGTFFLDEIGDLSHSSQVKLLRLLQEHEYFPIGSDIPRQTDTHIITSTNRDLEKLLASGQFRKDLYYRLDVHHVHVPPLREHKDDIYLLVEHFLAEAAVCYEKKKPTPPPELFILLENYSFPGNVRELRGMIYNAVSSHAGGVLSMKSFRKIFTDKHRESPNAQMGTSPAGPYLVQFPNPLPSLKQVETLLIQEAMKQAQGNQTIAAQLLGITRQTLNYKLKKEDES
ncbi:MAG TPA: sigma-54 dependent transcriptional regulator [Candidatus Kapabacteria bacterium]|nr:sigma-54 dependent transcriptional regulator [Candidatus Kapabacteria bacterium]